MPGHAEQLDEIAELGECLRIEGRELDDLTGIDGLPAWRQGYPYDVRLSRRQYERTKRLLQIELLKLQAHVKDTKLWFSVSPAEQAARFAARSLDPVRQWKLSPTDLASLDKWDDYTAAKETMFFHTDTGDAPWTVVKGNDKKRARLEAMRVLLSQVEYPQKDQRLVGRPDPLIVGPAGRVHEDDEDPSRFFPAGRSGMKN